MTTEETRPRPAGAKQARQQAPTADNPKEEATYTRDQLVEGARTLLRVHPLIVQGALGRAPASQKTFTLAEATELIRDHNKVELNPLEGAPA